MATKSTTAPPSHATTPEPSPLVPQSSLQKLLAPFTASLNQDARAASPQTNPTLQNMMGSLLPQYQSAIAPYMSQYNANVQSLPSLLQGAVQDSGKAAMLSDLLNALRYQFIYGGQSPSSALGQYSTVLDYLLGQNVNTQPTSKSAIPNNLAPIIDQSGGLGGTSSTTPSFG